MLKLVPTDLREASFALGVPRWRTIMKVVLPTAFSGMITGIMLAIARVMGETAPLILLIGSTKVINTNPFDGAQSSLPTFIWFTAGDPNQFSLDRAWAAALTLILIIALLNIGARVIARFTATNR
jgi:phosphate transport system permease protein